MNLKLPQLIALVIGGVLIYSAVKDVNAVDVIKAVLTGKPLPVGPGAGGRQSSYDNGTSIVTEDGTPTGGTLGENGEYFPPTDGNTTQPQVPGGPRNVPSLYIRPFV